MKFFPININLNANIPTLNFNNNKVTCSCSSQFLNHLNLVLTKHSQKGLKLVNEPTENELPLVFIFLFLINFNEKISQKDFPRNENTLQLTECNKKFFSAELNNIFNLLNKGIENNPELKKLINKLQRYLNIQDYKNINDILTKFAKTNKGVNKEPSDLILNNKLDKKGLKNFALENDLDNDIKKLYKKFNLNVISEKLENNKTIDLKKVNQLIKEIELLIKNKYPNLVREIKNFQKVNLANKEPSDLILNNKLDKKGLKNFALENDLDNDIKKLYKKFNLNVISEKLENDKTIDLKKINQLIKEIELLIKNKYPNLVREIKNFQKVVIDILNENTQNISENIKYIDNEKEPLDLKSEKHQISEFKNKLINIMKETKGIIKIGQRQKTVEEISYNLTSLKGRNYKTENDLLKTGKEVQIDRRLLKSGYERGFNNSGVFEIRSFELNNENQGTSVPVENKFRDEIFKQVQIGIFKNFGEGRREVSIKLHPPELGALKVVIQVHDNEVSMVLHTEHRDVANALNKYIVNFEKSFEQQGLKIVKVEVKNDLFSGNENSLKDFTGSRDHAQNDSAGSKRRRLFDFGLVGEGEISAMDYGNMVNLARLDRGSLYVVA